MSEARIKDGWLWFAVLGSPIAWAMHLSAGYPLVGFSCRMSSATSLMALTAGALGVIAASIVVALLCRIRLARESVEHDVLGSRRRFMADLGVLLAPLFFLVTAAGSLALFFDDPCDGFRYASFSLLERLAHASKGVPTNTATSRSPGLDACIVLGSIAVSLVHLRRSRSRAGAIGPRGSGLRTHLAAGWGIAVTTAAVISPVDDIAHRYFSAHMAQHLALTLVAAPLLVASRVPSLLPWALPTRARTAVFALVRNVTRIPPTASGVTVSAIFAGSLWIWHLPPLYEAALASNVVHALEHASFLGSAVLLFSHLRWCRVRAAQAGGVGVLVAFTSAVQSGILGALMTFTPDAWYGAYEARPTHGSLSPLEDQQLAGLLMWIPGSLVFIGAGIVLGWAWLDASERRVRARERRRRWMTKGSAVALGVLLVGCERSKPTVGEMSVGVFEGEGRRGAFLFEIRLSPMQPHIGELFEVTTTVREVASGAPVRGARVVVDASMPNHGHGMTTRPEHLDLGDGRYLTRGMKLHMPGAWTVRASAITSARTDSVELTLNPLMSHGSR